jgi:hypothetical protein
MTYVLHIKEICIFLRERATHCKIRQIRLKIRRPQGHGGSTPPPGTKILKSLMAKRPLLSEWPFLFGGCFGGCWHYREPRLAERQVNGCLVAVFGLGPSKIE